MTRILGIDPGLQKCGWGIIESNGNNLKFIACGLIKTDAKTPLANRLAHIHKEITTIIKTHAPQTAAVEETFVNKNPASALKLGQARGVAMSAPAIQGLLVGEYSANKIKKSVVGAGHADKNQIQHMIKILMPSCGQITDDEADALAVAITHAHHRQ